MTVTVNTYQRGLHRILCNAPCSTGALGSTGAPGSQHLLPVSTPGLLSCSTISSLLSKTGSSTCPMTQHHNHDSPLTTPTFPCSPLSLLNRLLHGGQTSGHQMLASLALPQVPLEGNGLGPILSCQLSLHLSYNVPSGADSISPTVCLSILALTSRLWF